MNRLYTVFLGVWLVISGITADRVFQIVSNKDISLAQLNQIIDKTNVVVNEGCSGTVIDKENGYILTASHCVKNKIVADETAGVDNNGQPLRLKVLPIPIEHKIYDKKDSSKLAYTSRLIAADSTIDLALLKVDQKLIKADKIELSEDETNLEKGEPIYIVGNPFLLDSTLNKGIISFVDRKVSFPWTNDKDVRMIQFSGGIVGGNSGGAILNQKGELVGVPIVVLQDAAFIGMATPVSVVKKFLKDNCAWESFDKKFNNESCRISKQS